jgi:hypothetical protein
MLSWIGKRLTFVNVTLVVALVLATAGGAYAGNRILITSTKQISKKVIAQLKGKTGPPGPAGLQGPAGPQGGQGLPGAAGKDGLPGAEGKEGKQGPQGVQGLPGKEGKEGQEGQPWTPNNVLPSGGAETGTWAVAALPARFVLVPNVLEFEFSYVPISFTIKLAKGLEASNVHVIGPEEGEGEANANVPAGCKGNVGKPEAENGHLCIFENTGINVKAVETGTVDPVEKEKGKASPYGTVIEVHPETKESPLAVVGTWAVTGE